MAPFSGAQFGGGSERSRRYFFRDFEAGQHLDLFLVSAVTTVLAIRFYLGVTHFPKIGGGNLHVAHMLWGGLLMLASIVVLQSYIGRGVHQLSALLGGIGFGAFIDEIGKFVTRDNDYFYKPSVALIYAVFVLLYLTFRSIHRDQIATPDEFLVNTLQELEYTTARGLTREERNRVLGYLGRTSPNDRVARAILEVVRSSPVPAVVEKQGPFHELKARVVRFYREIAVTRGFHTAVVAFFVGQLLLKVSLAVAQIFSEGIEKGPFYIPLLAALDRGLRGHSPTDWAQLLSSLLSGVFVAGGVVAIRKSRLTAFRMFQRSILISICLTQVFSFYREEFSALVGLFFNLLVFLALRFMIARERARPGRTGAVRERAAG